MKHAFETCTDWMKIIGLAIAYAVIAFFFGAPAHATGLELDNVSFNNHVVRIGTQTAAGSQKACVLFLEGLGDSIRNHAPLFDALSSHGYRVLAFDYYGQGGSSGSMNEIRVEDGMAPAFEIGGIANFVWSRDEACAQSKKFVVGWSTGGLAAYKMAAEKSVDGVVLLAPGIVPKWFIGEAAGAWNLQSLNHVVTARTLTRFAGAAHVDPIHPDSPAKVPFFAKNLIFTSWLYRGSIIPASVKGLVFLSGAEDTYVDRSATLSVLRKNAPHFSVVAYNGALHELDNELPAISRDVRERTVRFFDSIR